MSSSICGYSATIVAPQPELCGHWHTNVQVNPITYKAGLNTSADGRCYGATVRRALLQWRALELLHVLPPLLRVSLRRCQLSGQRCNGILRRLGCRLCCGKRRLPSADLAASGLPSNTWCMSWYHTRARRMHWWCMPGQLGTDLRQEDSIAPEVLPSRQSMRGKPPSQPPDPLLPSRLLLTAHPTRKHVAGVRPTTRA